MLRLQHRADRDLRRIFDASSCERTHRSLCEPTAENLGVAVGDAGAPPCLEGPIAANHRPISDVLDVLYVLDDRE
jgi:hypothetical protein